MAGTIDNPSIAVGLDHLAKRNILDQQLIGGHVAVGGLDPQPGGGIALRIDIHHQNPLATFHQSGGKIDRGRCLSDPAFWLVTAMILGPCGRDRSATRHSFDFQDYRCGVGNTGNRLRPEFP